MAMPLEVIQPDPTWDVLDSTKLSTYMRCSRKYFYSYVLGWRSDSPNNDLVFGSAWHLGIEHLTRNGCSPKSVLEAQVLFLEYYRKHFSPEMDKLFVPKTAANGTNSLVDYATRYAREIEHTNVLYTELAGVVLVSDTRTMTFKCDEISRDERGNVFGRDHKTSKRHYTNWGEHWVLSTQMLTYLHALKCLYPDQDDISMVVRSAFFYTKEPTLFEDYPISKTDEQMQAWLERTNQWIDRMSTDMEILVNEDNTDEVAMRAFPQNDTACFDFGRRCEFFDFCNAWSNPLTRCDQVPIGFNVEWWNPLARPEIRTKINLATQSNEPLEMDGVKDETKVVK